MKRVRVIIRRRVRRVVKVRTVDPLEESPRRVVRIVRRTSSS